MMLPAATAWRRRVLAFAVGWAWCLASQAADPARGAALFAQAPAPGLLGCIDCHSDNPHLNNFGNIWVGRNAVALIERAVGTNTGGMGYLGSYRSPADLADIAAYLGNTPGGGLSFPLTAVGSSSAVQTVTVRTSTKVGAGAFEARTEGDFAVRASSCGTDLPRFAGCTVDIAFTPTAGGSRSGALLLSHDGTPTLCASRSTAWRRNAPPPWPRYCRRSWTSAPARQGCRGRCATSRWPTTAPRR